MGLESNKKFKLKKAYAGLPVGTEGFITREPEGDQDTYGVRICGVDKDLPAGVVEVIGGAS